MKAFKICAATAIAMAAITFLVHADDKDKRAGKSADKHAVFEKIKALKGEWKVTKGTEHAPAGGTISYRLTAGGSTVQETMFGGTEHEMVTMYFMDGDHLSLTHYCMLGNRPHMRAEKQSTGDKLVFKCHGHEGESTKPAKIEAEDHMHQVTITFVDADHFKTEWVLFKGGKQDSVHEFEMERGK